MIFARLQVRLARAITGGVVTYIVDFRGFPACPCLAKWLPAYEAELQRRGTLTGPLRIYQLIGGAQASGGTHASGGAFDITDLVGDEDVWVARQMGADASWARTSAQGFTPHIHGVLTGCPHNGPARYQIDDVRAGWNGLAGENTRARDDGPRPLSNRTWREGIAWAQAQEDDMGYRDWEQADKNALAEDVVEAFMRYKPKGSDVAVEQLLKQAGNAPGVVRQEHRKDRQ